MRKPYSINCKNLKALRVQITSYETRLFFISRGKENFKQFTIFIMLISI